MAYTRPQARLRRRATLVQARVQVQQSREGLPTRRTALQALLRPLTWLDTLIQKPLREALAEAGWRGYTQRCRALEGVGPLTATALTTVFHRGRFQIQRCLHLLPFQLGPTDPAARMRPWPKPSI